MDHSFAVSLTWSDSGNEEQYDIYRRTITASATNNSFYGKLILPVYASDWIHLVTLEADTTGYIDNLVQEDTTYEYQVVASNKNGTTSSNIIEVYVPIARPGDFTLSAEWVGNIIHLNWTESLGTPAGGTITYSVYRSATEDFASPVPISNCQDTTSTECYDNSPSLTEPYYKVVATNLGGSTDSNIVKITPPVPKWHEISP